MNLKQIQCKIALIPDHSGESYVCPYDPESVFQDSEYGPLVYINTACLYQRFIPEHYLHIMYKYCCRTTLLINISAIISYRYYPNFNKD